MKRTTVYLEEQTDLALSQIAKWRGQAKAELIREALAALIEREQESPRPLPRSVGMGHSGMSNWAERDEEILLELLEQDHQEIVADYEARQKSRAS